jgi:ATP-dependent exoDNAse (exonuclease V) alpha subunit
MNVVTQINNNYNLNQGQKHAADKFFEFLFSPDKEFIISGPAGVGKTYLMNYIIDNTMPRYQEMCKLVGIRPEFDSVMMTATTNKAAEVLSVACKRPTSTVHSFFNLTVKDDFTTGQTILKRTNKWVVYRNIIIFIDESSMIDTELWKLLHEGTMDCKLVYVGDRHQLAPVMESISPIYHHNSPMVELLTPVRNANQPALMDVCEQLRETVATGEFKPIRLVPGVIDLLDDSKMKLEMAAHFQNQTLDSRILAYTNKRVIQFNDHIRALRQLPAAFQKGELLVNNSVYHHRNGMLTVEAEVEVIQNWGPSQMLIDEKNQIYLDINRLDLESSLGSIFFDVPFATDRSHLDQLLKFYSRMKDWPAYFNLKNNIADLRPRDAATVHKAQGSTYDTVFVDLANISTCNIQNQVARMLYVAFSRARNRVFLYGNLAQKYGGVILP